MTDRNPTAHNFAAGALARGDHGYTADLLALTLL
jgi:hypothetical protein